MTVIDCYQCIHRRAVPGSANSRYEKPDNDMTGNFRAIYRGWFSYPFDFDPVWATKACVNFQKSPSTTKE